ncbi:MAG: hypothetical protein ACKOAU_15430 [Pirellula sp.]
MADELDEFLKQAAQRRMQRQQEKQVRQNPGAPTSKPQSRPPAPSKQKSPPPKDLSQARPAIFEDDRSIADRTLEPSISQRHVSTNIDLADEGIDAYVRSTIGDGASLGELQKRPNQKQQAKKNSSENKSDERPTVSQSATSLVGSSELVKQLRDPKTLRMAILAHEILRRPYQ